MTRTSFVAATATATATVIVWLAVVVLGFLAAMADIHAQTNDRAGVMLQTAIQTEMVDGDLNKAIELYEEIAARFGNERSVAARALWHLGQSYEKLGQARAREVYQRLVRDYADQTTVLALAREGLSRLTVEPAPSPTMTVRELMRSGERRPGEVSEPTNGPNFAISGDGQLFVYTDWRTGDLVMKNMTTGEAHSVYGTDFSGDEWFESPVLSPDEKRVAFVRYPNRTGGTTRVEVDSLEGGHRQTVLDFKEVVNVFTHDWSPDGENLLIASEAADRSVFLATVSLEDKTLQRLVTLDWGRPRRAQYSPDGRFIAYDSTKGGDSKIYLISADGSRESVLVDSSGEDDSPLWTRDGRFLLFRSDRSGKWDLYALRMQNGEPAGQEVVVKSNLGAATLLRGVTTEQQLFVFELVGGRDIGITERIDKTAKTVHVRVLPKVQTIENKSPSFAPDGERLAYLAGSPMSRLTIRVTDLEGKVLKDIPLDRRFSTNDPPRFSPGGEGPERHTFRPSILDKRSSEIFSGWKDDGPSSLRCRRSQDHGAFRRSGNGSEGVFSCGGERVCPRSWLVPRQPTPVCVRDTGGGRPFPGRDRCRHRTNRQIHRAC